MSKALKHTNPALVANAISCRRVFVLISFGYTDLELPEKFVENRRVQYKLSKEITFYRHKSPSLILAINHYLISFFSSRHLQSRVLLLLKSN